LIAFTRFALASLKNAPRFARCSAKYYIDVETRDNHWCEHCYNKLAPSQVLYLENGQRTKKKDLAQQTNDALSDESWVQCSKCDLWVHQICALFNGRENNEDNSFQCPTCVLEERKVKRLDEVKVKGKGKGKGGKRERKSVQRMVEDDDDDEEEEKPKEAAKVVKEEVKEVQAEVQPQPEKEEYYTAKNDDTPKIIAELLKIDYKVLVANNRSRLPGLTHYSKLEAGTTLALFNPNPVLPVQPVVKKILPEARKKTERKLGAKHLLQTELGDELELGIERHLKKAYENEAEKLDINLDKVLRAGEICVRVVSDLKSAHYVREQMFKEVSE